MKERRGRIGSVYDPEAAIPGGFSPPQLPTFIHRSASNLRGRANGETGLFGHPRRLQRTTDSWGEQTFMLQLRNCLTWSGASVAIGSPRTFKP